MLPPHCGQTRLMIDEMMLKLNGSVFKIGTVDLRSLSQVDRSNDCEARSKQLQTEDQFPDRR